MILNFEEYTVELNDVEISFAKQIARKLKKFNQGKENAVTNKRIQAFFFEYYAAKISDAKVRKLIQYIRQKNLAPNLCATSKGYFVAANETEIEEYLTGLKQRLNSIQFTLECFEKFRI